MQVEQSRNGSEKNGEADAGGTPMMNGSVIRLTAVLGCFILCHGNLAAGVGKSQVRYLGGTYVDVKEGAEGVVKLREDDIQFTWDKRTYALPFNQISSIEYGQKTGRRIGATIALGVTTLGLFALPMLLSRKRKHFATLGFKDGHGKPQALVLEFGKNINRSALKIMSLRSGVPIEFESEQAEKEFRH